MVSDLHQAGSVCGNTKLKCTETIRRQGRKENEAGVREGSPFAVLLSYESLLVIEKLQCVTERRRGCPIVPGILVPGPLLSAFCTSSFLQWAASLIPPRSLLSQVASLSVSRLY